MISNYLAKSLPLLLMLVLVAGCSRQVETDPIYQVPAEIQPFIDTFLKEAESRGHHLTLNNLIITYDANLGDLVCGQCNSNNIQSANQKIITFNSTLKCYENSQQQEALIFHELGHCVLGRSHTDDLLPNGDPKSIMIENHFALYSPCVYQIGSGNCNNTFKRTYYIDELFDPSTPIPDWAK